MYRASQFFRALTARVRPEEIQVLDRHLTPLQQALFRQMTVNDQRHALDVLETLIRTGYGEPVLLQAALLHDVGKVGAGLRLWHRVSIVLLNAGMPGLLDRLGRDDPGSWRYPFFAHKHHARRGAELARQAGCPPLTATLIRRHHEPVPEDQQETPEGRLLLALQAADGHR